MEEIERYKDFFLYAGDTKEIIFAFYDQENVPYDITLFNISVKVKEPKYDGIIIEKFHFAGSSKIIGERLGEGDDSKKEFLFQKIIEENSEMIFLQLVKDVDYSIDYENGLVNLGNRQSDLESNEKIMVSYSYNDGNETKEVEREIASQDESDKRKFYLQNSGIIENSEKVYRVLTRFYDSENYQYKYKIELDEVEQKSKVVFENSIENGIVVYADYVDKGYRRGIVTALDNEADKYQINRENKNEMAIIFEKEETYNLKGVYPFVIEFDNIKNKYTVYKNYLVVGERFKK